MQAYHVPGVKGMIKLDAMENPYLWPDGLKQRWLSELASVEVNRYPDPNAIELKERLREVLDIPDSMSIMLGNGSDELIQIIALAMSQGDRTFLTVEPGFVMYRAITVATGAHFEGVPLDTEEFTLDRNAILAAIEKYDPAIVFLAYPNNPTGNMFDEKVIVDVIRAAPGLVVLDEAYYAFSGQSFMAHLGELDNLLLMRTLSKSGLAGLRLGVLIGSNDWLGELEKLRLPYNINSLSQKTAEFILSHHELLEEQARQICDSRDALFDQLSNLDGIKTWPSAANFILFRSLKIKANVIYSNLEQQGILIKNLHGSYPSLEQCLRVTVGTEDENALFIEALSKSF